MESIKEIRSPLGGINTDDDDVLIPQMDYRDARNSVTDVASFKNVPSNKSALDYAINSGFQLYEGTNRTMGVAKDEKNNALIEFVWNQFEGHSIIRWYKEDNKLEYILSGQSILNFDYTKAHLINNPFVVDDLLYWTDNYNPPRKIDINKAIEFTLHPPIGVFHRQVRVNDYLTGYATDTLGLLIFSTSVNQWLYPSQKIVIVCPTVDRLEQTGDATVVTIVSYTYQTLVVTDRPWYVNDDTGGDVYQWNTDGQYYGLTEENISRMKYPPIFSPTTSYSTDISRKSNFLKNKFFFFRTRFFFDNHEYSTWGPISLVNYPVEDIEYGYSWDDSYVNNLLNVWYWTGPQEVLRVEVAVREATSEIWKLVERAEKYDVDNNSIIKSNVYHSLSFYNDVDGEGLDQGEISKPFNNVPELCGESELIGDNRIIDGDITEGKNNVEIDVSLSTEVVEADFPLPVRLSAYLGGLKYSYHDDDENLQSHDGKIFSLFDPLELQPVFKDTMWILQYSVCSQGEGGLPLPETDDNPYTRFSYQFFPDENDTLIDMMTKIKDTTNQSSGKRIKCYYPWDNAWPHTLRQNDFYELEGWMRWVDHHKYCFIYAGWVLEATGNEPHRNDGDDLPRVYLANIKLTRYDTKTLKYPHYKYGSILYAGQVYFDEQGRFGGVNKSETSKLQIPFLDDANQPYMELYSPNIDNPHNPNYINVAYQIMHRPPLWAKYWTWAVAKNTPVFRYAVAKDFKSDQGKTYFNVDVQLTDMIEDIPNGSVRPYFFQKGDRVRFLAGVVEETTDTFTSYNRFNKNLDFEIIGEFYDELLPTADEQNYEHYKDGTYWTDKDGNRVRNLYYRKLYVLGFDPGVYDVTEHDSYVYIPRYYSGVLVEIYTPNQNLTTDAKDVIYFESNEVHEIGNPGTALAYHKADVDQAADLSTPATGYLNCQNVYLKLRTWKNENYKLPVEDVNLSDYYESDVHNFGRINKFIYDAQHQRYKSKLQFGGVYYENSQINNLSSVDAADFVVLSEKFGAITGLREIGYTLKILQEFKRTSVYINKIGLMQAGGEGQVVATTSRLLGDVNISEDDFGCQDPESILVVDRSLVFYDRNIGKLIRDYSNGPVAISDLKTITLFQDLKDSILSHSEETFVQTGYDSFNGKIYLLMFYVVPNGVLINGSYAWQTNDPTFIECVGFSTRRNRTVSKFDFQYGDGASAEAMGNMGDAFVCFKDGVPWIHGQSTYCNFFGWQWAQKIKFTFNGSAQAEKIWENASVISNVLWSAPDNYDIQIAPNATYPRGMCSRLAAGKFTTIRGVSHAEFLRNMLSSSAVPSVVDLVNGDFLDGNSISIQLSNEETGEVILKSVIVQSLIHK